MFLGTKYRIRFEKKVVKKSGKRYELSDVFILKVLNNLQEEFDFEILKVELRGLYLISEIVIRATAKQKDKILSGLCEEIGDYVKNVQMF